jgi:hypothetical protein
MSAAVWALLAVRATDASLHDPSGSRGVVVNRAARTRSSPRGERLVLGLPEAPRHTDPMLPEPVFRIRDGRSETHGARAVDEGA